MIFSSTVAAGFTDVLALAGRGAAGRIRGLLRSARRNVQAYGYAMYKRGQEHKSYACDRNLWRYIDEMDRKARERIVKLERAPAGSPASTFSYAQVEGALAQVFGAEL